MFKSFVVLASVIAVAFSVETEGQAEYDAAVAGKAAFVKFLAPWWGHCKKMKPAWDKLSNDFKDSKTAAIVDVDCTTDGNKDVCSKFGVRGYPTIKYFTGSTDPMGDKYEGGRDYDSMKAFASENLGPSCGYDNLDLCDDEQKAEIEAVVAMSAEERADKLKELDDAVENAETNFKAQVEALQKRYESLTKEKEATIAAAGPELRVLRSVTNALKSASDDSKDEL